MKFYELAGYFERIEQTSGRIAMTELLAEIFKSVDPGEARHVAYLLQGRVAPRFVEVEFGIGNKLLQAAIAAAFDVEPGEVREQLRDLGDHGLTAERFCQAEGAGLTVIEVFERLDALARTSGEGSVESKVTQLASLMRDAGPLENRYLVRIPLVRLRLGVGDPTIMDGMSFAVVGDKSERSAIERAYNYVSDLGLVAERYIEGGAESIAKIRVEVGNPVRMAQAERLSSGAEIIKKIGRCAVEPKFDGFRLQIHRAGGDVAIFSRNLENMTGMFPEVAEAVRSRLNSESAIIEGEAMGYDPESLHFLPFQLTMSRRRKHGIEELAHSIPLKLLAFDVLYAGEEDLTPLSYEERRERLERLVNPNESIGVTESIVTADPEKVDTYFADRVEDGLEGILVKRLESPYQAGKRNFNWIKLKGSYKGGLSDSLDCAIVGYWRGRGKRTAWGIGAILTAVWDAEEARLKTIARVGTGFSDEEWVQIRELLDEDAREGAPPMLDTTVEADVWVEPRYVAPVLADELTRSPNHTAGRKGDEAGYALRFPRVLAMPRADKSPQDATTVAEVESLFAAQGRGSA
ncbi:MAG: ATP-dependent DNA ligase [Chloroflexi bacterium]|nr:ATP-dependent DNA ligase [Chloroflexota bacterium]MCY3938283.1 ATP-dependent DNA ligase [Chloroflexota bacterium]